MRLQALPRLRTAPQACDQADTLPTRERQPPRQRRGQPPHHRQDQVQRPMAVPALRKDARLPRGHRRQVVPRAHRPGRLRGTQHDASPRPRGEHEHPGIDAADQRPAAGPSSSPSISASTSSTSRSATTGVYERWSGHGQNQEGLQGVPDRAGGPRPDGGADLGLLRAGNRAAGHAFQGVQLGRSGCRWGHQDAG